MASPQRFTEVTDPGDEPLLVTEDFEILEEDADLGESPATAETTPSGGGWGWILFGVLVTACTATVLLYGFPMYDEVRALRIEKQRLADDLKNARAHEDTLAEELGDLDAARARLTASLAQKSVALEDTLRAQADAERRLRDEIKKNETRGSNTAPPKSGRRSRRR